MKARICWCIFLLICSFPAIGNENATIDSLRSELLNSKDDKRFEILLELGKSYASTDINKTFDYLNEASAYAKKNNDKEKQALVNLNLGNAYRDAGKDKLAIEYYESSLQLYEEISDSSGIATISINLGTYFAQKGDYEKGLHYYIQSLKINELLGNKQSIASSSVGIGLIYRFLNDFDKALENYNGALEVFRELNDENGIAMCLTNIASIYLKQGKFEESLQIQLEVYEIRKRLGNEYYIAQALGNLGIGYASIDQHDKAIVYLELSLEYYERLGEKRSLSEGYLNLAEVYHKLGNKDKELHYLKSSVKHATEGNVKGVLMRAYQSLSDYYETNSDLEKSLSYYKLYTQEKDSIFNDNTAKMIQEMQSKYESEKQENEIELLQKDKEIQTAVIRKNRIMLWTSIGGLVLLFVFFIILYNRFSTIRKQKLIIETQKILVEGKNKEITDSINYAKRLQDAILPPSKLVSSYLLESFIIYRPKDIVAGDFYFMDVIEDENPGTNQLVKKQIYYVAADCTGHGVPGAMVSIVGANELKRCIREFKLRSPGEILDKLSELVAENFAQSEEKIRDGMDLALCCLEIENDTAIRVHYSGANNPLWIVNSKRTSWPANCLPFKDDPRGAEIKANKQSIGYTENTTHFKTHTVELQEGDTLYTFSDGYQDQFGGEMGKKYKSANFKKLLIGLHGKTMEEQKNLINKEFENWKGDLEQIDDVCVIGVRV